MSAPIRAAAAALALLLVPLVGGCGDRQQNYCDAVKSHQQELADIAASGSQDAELQMLGIYRELQGNAPSDIADEWQQVVTALGGLDRALHDAGVDPKTYDRQHPPPGLTPAQRAAIDAAARQLANPATGLAMRSIQQEVLDVCHTPLSL